MPRFSYEQRKIAAALVDRPKTSKELEEELGYTQKLVEAELKDMVKLKLVSREKDGLYAILPEIAEKVRERKDIEARDEFRLRLRIIIEATAFEKELLLKQMNDIENALKKEPDFTVYDSKIEEPVESDGNFSTFLEANISVRDFRHLSKLLFFYGPSVLEVLKPQRYDVTIDELQDSLMDFLEMIHAYNHYILKLMNRAELDEFHRSLYEKKQA